MISFTIRPLPYLPEKNLQRIQHVTSILAHENNTFKKYPARRATEGQVTVIRPSIGVRSREHLECGLYDRSQEVAVPTRNREI
jgi:hypothetical protein